MDQLVDPAMMLPKVKLDPAEQLPVKVPEADYVVPVLLIAVIFLAIAPLLLPKVFRSTLWLSSIGTSVACYAQADKRQKHRAYFEATRDASFDVLAFRLARSVERELEN